MSQQEKVLIVDDEKLIRLNLRALLEDLGYRVVEAANGRKGLEVFNRECPDLVLADLRMPVMDGLSMITILRDQSPETPVIVISGTGTVRDAVDSLRLGAWDYVIKPVEDAEGLEIIIRRVVEKAQLIRENRRYRAHLEELVREQTEEIRESEARYRRLLESITSYVYTVTFKDGLPDATIHGPGCEAVAGFTPDAYAADPLLWYRMVHPDDRPLIIDMAKRILEERSPISAEHRIHHKDGTLRWIRNTLVPHRTDEGDLFSYDGIIVDITERKHAQEELERVNNRNRLILESAGEGIFGLDAEYRVSFINPAAAEALGYDADELPGKCFHEVIHMRDETGAPYPREACPICMTFTNGGARNSTDEIFWRKNGTSFPVEHTSTPIMENNHPVGVVVTFKDITERERMAKHLQQAQKMEAIGVLAGGIAHDFNNILSSIFGFAELAKANLSQNKDVGKYLDEVLNAGMRARDLVKHILLFSRQVDIKKGPVVLAPIVKESLKFLRASVPSTIEIKQRLNISNGNVMADPTEIHQILMNLCTNAAHAMGEKGGMMDVQLEAVVLEDESDPRYRELKRGKYIRLTVADTGHGIQNELIDRIFDPFFTTKERGEGTGLGLSIVHGIVNSMGGAVSVSSIPDKGTTFHVLLPMHEGEPIPTYPTGLTSKKGKGKILFVDDEKNIVAIGQTILTNLGYDVITTTSSLQALELFEAGSGEFDLVITDLTMPKLTGIELAKRLLKIRSDIPVMLCTGYSTGLSQEMIRDSGIRETVFKPMIARELAEAVDRVLNATNK